tara:strand:+ start:473 stop:880 length:408 start_codon:yes stop_codon:yes gene_type:complete
MKNNYREFLNKLKYNKILYIARLGDYSYASWTDLISLFVNFLVFPAITFQIIKTWRRRESKDFSPLFLLLQFLGGAPEGMVGLMLGIIFKNPQLIAIGIYAMILRSFMLIMRFFGTGGLIKPLWNNKKKYIGFKK